MTANNCKYYLRYLTKLVDQYNNNYYHSVGKKHINVDYSALAGTRIFLVKVTLKIDQEKYLLSILF